MWTDFFLENMDQKLKEEKRRELLRLMSKGFHFEIVETLKVRQPGFLGFFKPKTKEKKVHTFYIKEPTLYMLDQISLESIELDESEFNNLETQQDQKKYSRKHYRRMARVIAILVSGIEADESEILENQKLLFKYLKPSDLYSIVELADVVSNNTDFINSTRNVAAANVLNERQPTADLVEDTLQD